MGWSCSKAAMDTLNALEGELIRAGLMSNMNTWTFGGQTYFSEASRTEHRDGAITGTVYRMGPAANPDGGGPAYRVGSFRIDGIGQIVRWPAKTIPKGMVDRVMSMSLEEMLAAGREKWRKSA